MDAVSGLSPEDREILRGLIYREKVRIKNTTGRAAVFPGIEDNPPPTTEVYIAKVPAGGIPALTATTGHADDIPGKATCDIYTIYIESSIPRIRTIDTQRDVYNLSADEILHDNTPWIVTQREKGGSWLATATFAGEVGTGSDFCGNLILDCPDDSGVPGTGSEVTVSPPIGSPPISSGFISICNDGEMVPSRLYLTLTYGSDSVTVAITSTDGYSWSYAGGAVDVGGCGAGFQLVEANMYCTDRGWVLEIAVNLPTLQAFASPTDFPRPSVVSVDPFHYTTSTPGPVTTGCGFEVIQIDITL